MNNCGAKVRRKRRLPGCSQLLAGSGKGGQIFVLGHAGEDRGFRRRKGRTVEDGGEFSVRAHAWLLGQ